MTNDTSSKANATTSSGDESSLSSSISSASSPIGQLKEQPSASVAPQSPPCASSSPITESTRQKRHRDSSSDERYLPQGGENRPVSPSSPPKMIKKSSHTNSAYSIMNLLGKSSSDKSSSLTSSPHSPTPANTSSLLPGANLLGSFASHLNSSSSISPSSASSSSSTTSSNQDQQQQQFNSFLMNPFLAAAAALAAASQNNQQQQQQTNMLSNISNLAFLSGQNNLGKLSENSPLGSGNNGLTPAAASAWPWFNMAAMSALYGGLESKSPNLKSIKNVQFDTLTPQSDKYTQVLPFFY